ncbi:hypothetical protein [Petrocella atlantisensis]|uniref:hypothetical protein n=1 Tax=Petrocella atlantisensis TaxID=2173034 RepID=UPI000F64345A|nr:hypothetical protein [Petrocella atlantisensis]
MKNQLLGIKGFLSVVGCIGSIGVSAFLIFNVEALNPMDSCILPIFIAMGAIFVPFSYLLTISFLKVYVSSISLIAP